MEALIETNNRFNIITSDKMTAIDKINDSLYWGATEYFKKNDFTWIEVPIMTKITGACENVDTLYELEHFGKTAYLAQTGQLYLEGKIPTHKKVWTTILSSRAESKVDSRHLNQFTLVEFEHSGNFESLLENIEGVIQSMVKNVIEKNKEELKKLGRDVEELKKYLTPFKRMTYTNAISLLSKNGFDISWEDDLKHEHEMKLIELNNNLPLFITHFPTNIKFFNMRQNRSDDSIVNSADLLMPHAGESVGAAEREDDYEILRERLKKSQMFKILSKRGATEKEFEDYLNLVKKHKILHSGCGIGFNRISQSVLGSKDIRVSTNYPINASTLY
jgi:asparaginyl-tRNA synthetase